MLGYVSGVYDILRGEDLGKLDMMIQKSKESGNKYFAIGIYNEELCEALGISKPLKNIEDRKKIAEQLRGINFVFEISSLDKKLIEERARTAFDSYLKTEDITQQDNKKVYDIAYAPGTYDLFHAGHLENLLEAHEKSNYLIVGVKSDELVEKHKNRQAVISAEERMEILRHFKFVHDVYQYYTRDPHIAASWIKSKYNKDIDAIFLGSDLKKDFSGINDLNIVFTDRDEENMLARSTSGYIKTLKLREVNSEAYIGKKGEYKAQKERAKSEEGPDNNSEIKEIQK